MPIFMSKAIHVQWSRIWVQLSCILTGPEKDPSKLPVRICFFPEFKVALQGHLVPGGCRSESPIFLLGISFFVPRSQRLIRIPCPHSALL